MGPDWAFAVTPHRHDGGMFSLAAFETEMSALAGQTVSAAKAEALLLDARAARLALNDHEAHIVALIDEHVEAGNGRTPEEILIGAGLSSFEARASTARARTLNDLAETLPVHPLDTTGPIDEEVTDHDDSDHSDHDGTGGGSREGGTDEDSSWSKSASSGADGDDRARRGFRAEVNPENVDAIRRAEKSLKTEAERAAFAVRKPEIATLALELAPPQFARRLKQIVSSIIAECGTTLKERQRRASKLSWWTKADGMVGFAGELDPERGHKFINAVDREMKTEARQAKSAEGLLLPLDANLAASALDRLCERANNPEARVARPMVGLIVDLETVLTGVHEDSVSFSTQGPGEWVDDATRRRLLCDCDLQRIITDEDGEPINVGRRYRTATPAQRLALRAVYSSCAFPGCDQCFDWCQVHHVTFWEHDGTTDLENLVPLCSRHHHLVHEGGWRLAIDELRVVRVWLPNGRLHAAAQPDGPIRRSARQGPSATVGGRGPTLVGVLDRPSLFNEREPSNN